MLIFEIRQKASENIETTNGACNIEREINGIKNINTEILQFSQIGGQHIITK